MAKIQTLGKRASESAIMVLPRLYGQPIVNVSTIQMDGISHPHRSSKVIDRFIEKGILIPKDKTLKYGQSYVYKQYLDIFVGKISRLPNEKAKNVLPKIFLVL